jgi:hypothetical protein
MLPRFPRLFLAPSLVVAVHATASAQVLTSLDLASRSQRIADASWSPLVVVAPGLRFERPWASLSASGSLVGGDRRPWIDAAHIDGALYSRAWRGWRGSLLGSSERNALTPDSIFRRNSLGGRVSYRARMTGAWTGIDLTRERGFARVSPRLTIGGWQQVGNAVLTASVGAGSARSASQSRTAIPQVNIRVDSLGHIHADTIRTRTRERLDWTEGHAGVHWSRGRFAVDGALGLRVPTRIQQRTAWGFAEATLALSPRAALVGGGGVRASELAYATPRAAYVTLGVRLAPTGLLRRRPGVPVRPAPSGFDVRLTGADVYLIRLRAPQARTVELSGDFTEWKPLAMRNTIGDTWELTMRIAPGVHRVNIRIDGDAWVAPPGTNTVADEFNGTVGLVVVPGGR